MENKMIKSFWILALLFLIGVKSNAQNLSFLNSGKIEFERRINGYQVFERTIKDMKSVKVDEIEKYIADYKAENTQFVTSNFTLVFNGDKSKYSPLGEEKDNFLSGFASQNEVYNSLKTGTYIAKKKFFDTQYLISDSSKKIKWRLTDEVREIVGYQCRRANASLSDSVYVVAFYTDQIPTKSGPEMFNGLPGMILGVSLPNENITWFATKVTTNTEVVDDFKGKNGREKMISNDDFKTKCFKILKDYNISSKWYESFLCY